MKVVINQCYGGFSLSPKAVKMYYGLKGRDCYFFEDRYNKNPRYVLTDNPKNDFSCYCFDTNDIKEFQKNEGFGEHSLDSRPSDRSDPDLVKTVETLGEEASGQCAKLVIVEIPDGINWEIDDYDGMETVEEVHRRWN